MLFRETVAVYCENHMEHINTLCGQNAETLYIRIQFVPHRKLITSRLQRPGKQQLFIVRIMSNLQIHFVGVIQSIGMLKSVVHM
jgi:hypothetical protein